MLAINKQFLDDNLQHFLVLERAGYLRGLSGMTRQMMQNVISDEFQKGYTADLWCGQCCIDMVFKLYRHYHDWLRDKTQSKETFKDLTEGIIEMNKIFIHDNIQL
jgi:hypothetical protein